MAQVCLAAHTTTLSLPMPLPAIFSTSPHVPAVTSVSLHSPAQDRESRMRPVRRCWCSVLPAARKYPRRTAIMYSCAPARPSTFLYHSNIVDSDLFLTNYNGIFIMYFFHLGETRYWLVCIKLMF